MSIFRAMANEPGNRRGGDYSHELEALESCSKGGWRQIATLTQLTPDELMFIKANAPVPMTNFRTMMSDLKWQMCTK
jgi:hypothetical protein